ncbi:sortase-associated OmpA-like protein PdsO [Colwellia sp. MEBiC06753]
MKCKKNIVITTVLASSLLIVPMSHARDTSAKESNPGLSNQHQEELGFGAGAIIGGILAGPAGAMITGLAGNLIMKNINTSEKLAAVNNEKSQLNESYQTQIAQLKRQMQQAEYHYQQELVALEQNQQQASALQASNLMMSIQFNTGQSDVPEYYHEQILALANILKSNERLIIDLSGYTDLLGDSQLNQSLSLSRAQSVKTQLIKLGINESRINAQGYGAQHPIVANTQQPSSYYDRRVMIKVNNSQYNNNLKRVAKN